jgi:DNA-binding Lrp family transcriptional regulator
MELASALSAIPQVASVYLTDGTFGVHSLVFAGDMDALGEMLLDRLPGIDGTARARGHTGLEWFSGVRWRLGAISSSQARSLADGSAGGGGRDARTVLLADADRALFLLLQKDGRAGYRELARELGTSEDAVRRQLASLLRRGAISFRTDFVRGSGGWPAELVLWLAVPPERLEPVGADLGKWPQTRICMSVVGEANLLVMSQVHRLGDITGLLRRVREAFPEAMVRDQRVVLRPVKSWGRLLDRSGSAADVVPVDPWASLPFTSSP